LVSNQRNTVASLIVAAYHTAGQHGGQLKEAHHTPELEKITLTDPTLLLKQLDEAVRAGNQAISAATVQKYGEAGHPEGAVFNVLIKSAVREDGALHAEKYYHTVREEFATMRAAFRWRQLIALARVSASENGRTAPGYDEAKKLLGV
jgi:hypothetical protein